MPDVLADRIALGGSGRDQQGVGTELVCRAVDGDGDRLARLQQARAVSAPGQPGDRRRQRGHRLAEARAERAVVRLDRHRDELARIGHEAHLMDVELARDELAQPSSAVAVAGGQATTACASGCRILIFASERAPRPSDTATRAASIASSSAGSSRPADVGQTARWTLGGAAGSWAATRFPYSSSATNGQNGAISSAKRDRHSCSVAKAARWSASATASPWRPPQKRARETRTYQFDRSSTNVSSRRPAPVASYASRRCGDRRRSPHRSATGSSGRAPAARPASGSSPPGVHPSGSAA